MKVPELVGHSGSMLLHFYSDVAYNMTGFNITFSVDACPTENTELTCSGHGTCDPSSGNCSCDQDFKAWLPDGYSRIFRSYVFGPSGFWTMAPLRYAAKFDPFLSLDCAPHLPPWRNPRKGRDQILPSGNLGKRLAFFRATSP